MRGSARVRFRAAAAQSMSACASCVRAVLATRNAPRIFQMRCSSTRVTCSRSSVPRGPVATASKPFSVRASASVFCGVLHRPPAAFSTSTTYPTASSPPSSLCGGRPARVKWVSSPTMLALEERGASESSATRTSVASDWSRGIFSTTNRPSGRSAPATFFLNSFTSSPQRAPRSPPPPGWPGRHRAPLPRVPEPLSAADRAPVTPPTSAGPLSGVTRFTIVWPNSPWSLRALTRTVRRRPAESYHPS